MARSQLSDDMNWLTHPVPSRQHNTLPQMDVGPINGNVAHVPIWSNPTATTKTSHVLHEYKERHAYSLSRYFQGILCLAGVLGIILVYPRRFWPDKSTRPTASLQPTSFSVDGGYESELCPQAKPLFPSRHRILDERLDEVFANETFKLKAYEALGGAIRIPYVP